MRKIGIISIHYGVNFGSALQAMAMYKYLSGIDSELSIEVINYIPSRFTIKSRLERVFTGGISATIHKLVRFMRFESNNNKYKRYLRKNIVISPPLYSMEDLKTRYENYNLLVAGSDQIWNSDYNQGVDPVYFLQFASIGTQKIAYAASSGKDDYNEDEWKSITAYLSDFRAISLREKSLVSLFSNRGITDCSFVLDPTFLLSKDEWRKYEKEVKKCPQDYLLIYYLDVEGKDIIRLANRIAKERGLKTVLIMNGQSGKTLKSYDVDYIAHNITPDSYIWLFRHASFVVTNSFHGVAFSINMERQFVALRREKYNSRLDSILSTMDLLDRYVNEDSFEMNDTRRDIDYEVVNKKKAIILNESKAFIDGLLGEKDGAYGHNL